MPTWAFSDRSRRAKIGLGWVNFQVLRRTHASLAHAPGIDAKVRADQMGNGIGVNLDEYTVTGLDQRTAAVELLEASVLSNSLIECWSVS
jgi:hypothetical protein